MHDVVDTSAQLIHQSRTGRIEQAGEVPCRKATGNTVKSPATAATYTTTSDQNSAREAASGRAAQADGIQNAAAGLIEAGVKFIESIASGGAAGCSVETSTSRFERTLSGLFTRDVNTNGPALSIPLPESLSQEQFADAVSSLLNTLRRAASAASGGSIK
jgi:hypothetical protein